MNIFNNVFKKNNNLTLEDIIKSLRRDNISQSKDLRLLSDISESILSTLDISKLLQNSVDKIVKRYRFLGGILLLIEDDKLHAQSISQGRIASSFLKLIGKPISNLSIEIKENANTNYIVKSIVDKTDISDPNLTPFTTGVLSNSATNIAKRITNTKYCISLPIFNAQQPIGALFLSKSVDEDFSKELPVLRLIVNQLGIAITNARLFQNQKEQVLELQKKNIQLNAIRTRERDMMDIMGHELRTPLSIIRLSIGLMQEKLNGMKISSENIDKCNTYINRIRESLQRETRLLESMLTSTKLEAERIELHMEKVSINDVIKNSILIMGQKALSKGVELNSNIDEKEFFIFADRVRVAEIIDNFVSNAIKYTQKGSISILVSSVDDMVNIEIKDTGIGIPKEDIPHLGEKFYRVGQYSNNIVDKRLRNKIDKSVPNLVRPGGTGLGLYVSYNLVKLMNGKIDVKSKTLKGTTFTISLPIYNSQTPVVPSTGQKLNIFERLGFTQR